jgi:cell division topological specificity factor
MNLFNWIGSRGSAPVARDRLKILLAYERTLQHGRPDLLAILHDEIMAVIRRHVAVAPDKVQMRVDRGQAVSTIAIDIEIPSSHNMLTASGRPS